MEIVKFSQSVAVLIDGNNIELSIFNLYKNRNYMINFDILIPKLIGSRSLNRLKYFREGKSISPKLAERLHSNFYGNVVPCYKNADIPLTIEAVKLVDKVDTIIIISGDSDYIELIKYLKYNGIRVEIASIRESTSLILSKLCDYQYFISEEDLFKFNVVN